MYSYLSVDALRRSIRRAASGDRHRRLGLRATVRAVSENGFEEPRIHAPLPGPGTVRMVLPVDDAGVTRYFFNELFRRNTPWMAPLLSLAGATAQRVKLAFYPFRE